MAEINISKISDTRLKAQVRTTPEETEQAQNRALEKLQKKVKLPGFRPGKVPAHIVRQKFATELMSDTLNEAVLGCIEQIAAKSEHGFYSLISVDKVELKGNAYSFEVVFDLPPYLKPAKIKEATLRENIFQMSEEDYQEELRRIRLKEATYQDTSEPASKGDRIIFDYEVLQEGIPVGEVISDKVAILGEGVLDPALEAKILETKAVAGSEVRHETTLPDKEGKSQAYTIILTVKKVQKVLLPEVNEEWLQKNYPQFKTVADLKEEIRRRLEKNFNHQSLNWELNRALTQFEKASEFFFSESYLIDELIDFLKSQNLSLEQLPAAQVENLKKAIADHKKRGLVINYLMRDIRKNKSPQEFREGFRKHVVENLSNLSSEELNYIMSLYDATLADQQISIQDKQILNSLLSQYYNFLIKEYLAAEGVVKKGKKMSYKELLQEIGQT